MIRQDKLAVIVPVFKGEEFLAQLVHELEKLRVYFEHEDLGLIMEEAIFVDDCSLDASWEVLNTLCAQFTWIKVIKMPHNSGQHAATVEGIKISAADWLVTMDEDLQHRPKDIIYLWEQRNRVEADLVYAVPSGSVHSSKFRNLSSKLIKKAIAKLFSKKEVLFFNSFRLIKVELGKKVAKEFKKNDYLDFLLIKYADKISRVSLSLIDIRNGESGYNYFGLFLHSKRFLQSSINHKFLKYWKTTSP